ncbi:MAG: nucleoside-diphosphate kinase [Lentisphaeraceae bacterium]|nr:nucleoside-diphosphate kinase [Lentisphaeraceae bacterium]
MYEKSLVIVKPDGVQRSLVGTVLSRFEAAGLKIHAMKFQNVPAEQSKEHYSEHVDKAFYPTVEEYITSGPVLVFVLGGNNAIKKIRTMVGATEPASALPGTIRGDFAHQPYPAPGEPDVEPIRNLIHASATPDEASNEISIWFSEDELVDYSRDIDNQLSLK